MALLVDVDADEQENLEQNFPTISFTAAHGVARAAALAETHAPSLALVNLGVEDPEPGLGLVHKLTSAGWRVLVLLSERDTDLAFRAGQRGARDCLSVPLTPAGMGKIKNHGAAAAQVEQQVEAAAMLESASPSMRSAVDVVLKSAKSDAPVLIRGESGTGKSLLAAELHRLSPRAAGPFVEVSCPALPEHLLAAELFGHARGAFTGAVRDRVGRVETADGGTLFLDEIGDLSPGLQVQLLRFLQDHSFERLGESRTRRSNVRIVAATNRDLEADVAAGRFRLDLYYRLGVVDVRIPSLRERSEDILRLAEHILVQKARAEGSEPRKLGESAKSALLAHRWPGNVRELENELSRALVLCSGQVLEASDLSERIVTPERKVPFLGGHFSLDEIEREHIERVLSRSRSFEAAAAELGIDDSTLWRKRKRMRLSVRKVNGNGSSTRLAGARVNSPAPNAPAPSYRR
ncbi:MAG: sigma 54-interacting transcriptional regulator [Myxococcales bacterium]|nr:sigma 54-interacting transcriptional regulator [Myxococcales bacterium]MCB9580059.1 sigma 54-interacting transcriptional regulator [Polyangiaceae bacterium]